MASVEEWQRARTCARRPLHERRIRSNSVSTRHDEGRRAGKITIFQVLKNNVSWIIFRPGRSWNGRHRTSVPNGPRREIYNVAVCVTPCLLVEKCPQVRDVYLFDTGVVIASEVGYTTKGGSRAVCGRGNNSTPPAVRFTTVETIVDCSKNIWFEIYNFFQNNLSRERYQKKKKKTRKRFNF